MSHVWYADQTSSIHYYEYDPVSCLSPHISCNTLIMQCKTCRYVTDHRAADNPKAYNQRVIPIMPDDRTHFIT